MSQIRRQIFFVLLSIFPEAVLESMLIPLYPYIVKHLLKQDDGVEFYVGLYSSAFYMPLFIMNIIWGTLSDRYGRKPVLLCGLAVGSFCAFLLGATKFYFISFFARFLAGIFGSNSTVAKSMIGDLCLDPMENAWGISMYGSVFGISGILGPLLGSFLYNPSLHMPWLISTNGIFGTHQPQALLGMLMGLVTLAGFFITLNHLNENEAKKRIRKSSQDIQLKDTLLPSNSSLLNASFDQLEDDSMSSFSSHESEELPYQSNAQQSTISILYKWKILGPIFFYCIIAWSSMIYMTAIPIFLSASKLHFGLNLTAQQTSYCTMIISMVKLPLQLYGFNNYLIYFKTLKRCYRFGMSLLIPAHAILLFLSLNASSSFIHNFFKWILLFICMFLIGVAEVFAYMSIIVMITESVQPLQNNMLGIVHGLASTCSALVRTCSPPMAGLLWQIGNGHLVFGFNGLFVFILGVVLSHRLL